mgnify:CR=1 FL=1
MELTRYLQKKQYEETRLGLQAEPRTVGRWKLAGESFARASNYLHDKSIQGAEVKGPPGATEMQKAHTAPPPVLQAKKSQERPKKPLRVSDPKRQARALL